MTTDLQAGSKVRVKPLGATGTILRVSTQLRNTPYLVSIPGYGERGYSADQLEPIPVLTLPPKPVAAVRAGQVLKCGKCSSLNLSAADVRQMWRAVGAAMNTLDSRIYVIALMDRLRRLYQARTPLPSAAHDFDDSEARETMSLNLLRRLYRAVVAEHQE